MLAVNVYTSLRKMYERFEFFYLMMRGTVNWFIYLFVYVYIFFFSQCIYLYLSLSTYMIVVD